MFACQKLLSTFHNFLQHCIFQSKAKFDAHMLFFQVHRYLGMEKLQWYSCIWQNTQKLHMLKPYSTQEMTKQTVVYPKLVADVCASSSSSVMLWSVQKLWSHHVLTSELVRLWQRRGIMLHLSWTSPLTGGTHHNRPHQTDIQSKAFVASKFNNTFFS
jgi:hypothetical protein